MRMPGMPDVQAEMEKFYTELAAIRGLLERLLEIEEGKE